jgi:hypothetical protein
MADDVDYVRQLLGHRVPELSEPEIIEALFENGVLADIAEAVGDVIEAMEARLDRIEEGLTASAASAATVEDQAEVEAPRPRRVAA